MVVDLPVKHVFQDILDADISVAVNLDLVQVVSGQSTNVLEEVDVLSVDGLAEGVLDHLEVVEVDVSLADLLDDLEITSIELVVSDLLLKIAEDIDV